VLLGAAGCAPAGVEGFVVVVQGAVAGPEGLPVEGAVVALRDAAGADLGEATTGADGTWSFPVVATAAVGNGLDATVTAEGLGEGLAHWDVNVLDPEVATLRAGPVQDWEAVERPLACVRLDEAREAASVRGRIVDPSGAPVPGLPGVLQRGWDAQVGAPAEAELVTDADGAFSALVDEPGLYTVYVAPTGPWAGTRFPVLTAALADAPTATIAPLQAPGHLLATLFWSGDVDLDLHLTAPETDAAARAPNQRFHVWADAPAHPERPAEGEDYTAELVGSAVTGPGPEVITLNQAVGAGELRLSVMDRSHADADPDPELAASGALVQWWAGEDVPRYAWVSPLALATTWRPVGIDSHQATVYAVEAYASGVDPTDDDAF
jgi:hypothetical protein